jgi:hypothetical protein
MLEVVVGIILLISMGSCVVKEQCKPDSNGKTYKVCKELFEKVD